ncbi:MAG: hypothetical protein ACE5G1_03595, partial [bacterium]
EAKAVVRFNSFDGNDPTLTQSRETVLTSRSFAERVVAQMGLSLNIDNQENRQISRRDIFSRVSTTQNPVPGAYSLRFSRDGTYKLVMMLDDDREKVISEGLVSNIIENELTVNGFTIQLAPNVSTSAREVAFKVYPFRDVVKDFRDKTGTQWNRTGNLMTITLTDKDPDLAVKMTNRLAEIFVHESASLKSRDSQKKSELLEEQVRLAKGELDAAEKALQEFKENNAVDLNAEQEAQLNRLVADEQRKKDLSLYRKTLRTLLQKSNDENA